MKLRVHTDFLLSTGCACVTAWHAVDSHSSDITCAIV